MLIEYNQKSRFIPALPKLLYYAQGIHLALNNVPLFSENICAWKHGPVVEEVYTKYRVNGRNEINTILNEEEKQKVAKVESNEQARQALELAYENFAGYTAWQLRNKTHEKGGPWEVTINKFGESSKIDNDLIRKYFDENLFDG